MTPRQHRWFMVGFWLVLLSMGIGALADGLGGVRAVLLTLLLLTLAQMAYGALCRRVGKVWASAAFRLGPLVLLPAMVLSRGVASDVLAVILEVCNLVATLGWSDDDIGGWGRRRWAQVRQAGRRFSKPVMGGLTPRA